MDLGRLPEACYLGESSRQYLRDTEVRTLKLPQKLFIFLRDCADLILV